MESTKRRKRAAPDQLYRHCLQGGDCIPDVQNKYEQKTWADIFLKVFGSLLYLGNLGIGTGKGSGGSLGYRPLGSTRVGEAAPITPARPSILIDAVGPSNIVPIDASTPAVVPLSEGTLDSGFIAPDAGPGVGVEELELYTINDPTTDVGGVQPTPTVVSTEEGAVAVIDALPAPDRPVQVFYDPNPMTESNINIFPALPSAASDVNVFVDSFSSDVIGGFDEIPLQRLDFAELNIEEAPMQSTPVQKVEAALSRAKTLYNRYFKQVPVRSATFLTQPSSLVQFEFENPAFEDISIQFERDLAQVAAAPDAEFADVITLHRPQLSSVEGTVRVSRLGETGTITTRSGLVIGQKVHFYHDLSEIEAVEQIELHSLGEYTGLNTVVDDILASTVVDPTNATNISYSEDAILDEYTENFNNAHLIITATGETEETIFIPTIAIRNPVLVNITDIDSSLIVSHQNDLDAIIEPKLIYPASVLPNYLLDTYEDFFLYPGLYPKKRRRIDVL
uniref:Minor capsid protein L2 n=1 Tax=Gammapapillomavirus 12 TaxID=1513257 RepID=A0A2D2AMK7_9PAPI|nr:L2 [Gammapapillomavirus 12]